MIDYKKIFVRNLGILDNNQQEILRNSGVGIAGCGADGGLLAERIVRLGIGRLHLADPDEFEITNLNRQFGCTLKTLGKNKAEVIGKIGKAINPSLKLEIYKDGVNKDNVENFCSNVDIIIDEIEFTRPQASLILHEEARRQNIPVVLALNVGWGVNIFAFSPRGMSFAEYIGINLDRDITALPELKMGLLVKKFCPKIPSYIQDEIVKKVLKRKMEIPGVSSAVALEAAFVSTMIVLFLTGQKDLIYVPKFLSIDMHDFYCFAKESKKEVSLVGDNSRISFRNCKQRRIRRG